MARADQFLITVSVDGEDLGIFDKLTGGEVESEETKYRPGGMQPHVSLGGAKTVANVVVSRMLLTTDNLHALYAKCGRAGMVVSRSLMDDNGNAFGRPLVYSGKLQRVAPPEVDSEGSDAALLELECAPSGSVG